ncbi:transcription antitermination factor NusB [Mangrovibacillus cuniculi]|uniref:Transcription antitermination protein NusB n=1 Tax=Mangrovibacillus cuniculi TaxID=2593652 RepID=A0A7S8CBA7_9BACI|nr:transcription antitermination factor NusB [Mangrovibacillus cuniculi]QPC46824.1 transcription antitermination factor NusB [Mangrovibacillus cuniculi]
MKRREARTKALQVLFQLDGSDLTVKEALSHVVEDEQVDTFLSSLVEGTWENKEEIDQTIQSNLENWTVNRLAKIDRNVIRLATYELKFQTETPDKVVMNEAVEIAKTFGDDQSSKFVNSVLAKIHQG